MSRRNYQKHDPDPFSLYNRSTTASHYVSDHKNGVQKKPEKRRSDGLLCLDKAVLAQGGGGGLSLLHRTERRRRPWIQQMGTARETLSG